MRTVRPPGAAARTRFAHAAPMLLPALAVVGALLVAAQPRVWWDATVLGLGVLAALVAAVRWPAGGPSGVTLPCLAVTTGVWLFGVLAAGSGTAFYCGLSLVGALAISRLPRHHGAATLGLTVSVAAVGAARLLVTREDVTGLLTGYVVLPAAVTAALTGLVLRVKRFHDLVAEVEEARERAAELALVHERIRCTGDPHDIQSRTPLHLVKLKTTLAQKLVHSDLGRAEKELREIHALVAGTTIEAREDR